MLFLLDWSFFESETLLACTYTNACMHTVNFVTIYAHTQSHTHTHTQLLGASSLIDKVWNRNYVLSTQGRFTGGFSKWPDSHPGNQKKKHQIICTCNVECC